MSRPKRACDMCHRHDAIQDANYACEERLSEDVQLLNASNVHIVGDEPNMSRETIHALAAVVRTFLTQKDSTK